MWIDWYDFDYMLTKIILDFLPGYWYADLGFIS